MNINVTEKFKKKKKYNGFFKLSNKYHNKYINVYRNTFGHSFALHSFPICQWTLFIENFATFKTKKY